MFEPQQIWDGDDALKMRLPLGRAYRGRCHAPAAAGAQPLKLCNLGYARGRCERFPPSHDVDANRFSRASDGVVTWIEEAGHAPLRFGPATGIAIGSVAWRQLQAFQESRD